MVLSPAPQRSPQRLQAFPTPQTCHASFSSQLGCRNPLNLATNMNPMHPNSRFSSHKPDAGRERDGASESVPSVDVPPRIDSLATSIHAHSAPSSTQAHATRKTDVAKRPTTSTPRAQTGIQPTASSSSAPFTTSQAPRSKQANASRGRAWQSPPASTATPVVQSSAASNSAW